LALGADASAEADATTGAEAAGAEATAEAEGAAAKAEAANREATRAAMILDILNSFNVFKRQLYHTEYYYY
jgi:membrane protein involved in colicin uptake